MKLLDYLDQVGDHWNRWKYKKCEQISSSAVLQLLMINTKTFYTCMVFIELYNVDYPDLGFSLICSYSIIKHTIFKQLIWDKE